MDPDGKMCGDFVDRKGRIIGNDGINDGKVYVLKISKYVFLDHMNLAVNNLGGVCIK